ncbi:DEAD/DEAH box helicase [Levilactobacillus brevis]|uniref:DEAD/DEAH box helicase n=1 Tax=Levilactobacillus brevis TaxID=1580 RepID=UPI001BAC8F06|nr:DEAD/DEAH box helicase [Levilactobacillus brevis]MBS1005500.1 DEAD/DEAH box helicase [Levilactobacillus brevis]
MGIFEDLVNKNNDFEKPTKLEEIFSSLNQVPGYDYPRAVQSNFFREWFPRRDEKDLIGVLGTGTGKTLLGLLVLQSYLNDDSGPCLYLCPTKQLVKQTVKEAHNFGVSVVSAVNSELPIEFINSEAILVTTFDKLFNGQSKFGFNTADYQKIGGLVVDDAHVAINRVRQACTTSISREDERYNAILDLYNASLDFESPSKLDSIKNNEFSHSAMKVPYWAVDDNLPQLLKIIDTIESSDNIQKPFLLESKNLLDVFISYKEISIRPQYSPVNLIPSFSEAKHRLFLSATFTDAGNFISELGIDKNSITNPIKINSLDDTGQKWIMNFSRLAPSIKPDLMRDFFKKISQKYEENVLVLTPSNYQANLWKDTEAKVYSADNLSDLTKDLETNKPMIAVLANKYDGINLPGNLCHITVIDETPNPVSIADMANKQRLPHSESTNAPIIHEIEQGMGRAVRSKADYSLIFLMGTGLSNYIYTNDDLLSVETKAQWEFSRKITDEIRTKYTEINDQFKQIYSIISGVIKQETKWTDLYKSAVSKGFSSMLLKNLTPKINYFDCVNNAWILAQQGQYKGAVSQLQENLDNLDGSAKAVTYENMARYVYKYSKQEAFDLQLKAHRMETHLFKTTNTLYEKHTLGKSEQGKACLTYIKSIGIKDSNELATYIESINNKLRYSPEADEQEFRLAIENLGSILGCDSSQPEAEAHFRNGSPDNLWIFKGSGLVIEDKNNAIDDKISRDDIQQIDGSSAWFSNTYKVPLLSIIFHRSNIMAPDANTVLDIDVVSAKKFQKLKSNISKLAQIINQLPFGDLTADRLMKAFKDTNLLIVNFKSQYCVKAKHQV